MSKQIKAYYYKKIRSFMISIFKSKYFVTLCNSFFLGVMFSYIMYFDGNKDAIYLDNMAKMGLFIFCLDAIIEYIVKYVVAIYETIKGIDNIFDEENK